MARITALIHTHNDAERIGRTLESLRACDEALVVDHASTDETVKVARQHGATLKEAVPGVNFGVYAIDAHHDWILCLLPTESLSEALEASLFEWREQNGKAEDPAQDKQADGPSAFSSQVREESDEGWKELGPQTRLVNRNKVNWTGELPANDPAAIELPGHILRFSKP